VIDLGSGATAAFALTAGVLAAFNPCGFALLPAYLTLVVAGSAETGVSRLAALRRAAGFALRMTLGFVTVFTGFGLLFVLVTMGLQGDILPYLSYVTVAIAIVLIAFGIRMAAGHEVGLPGFRVKGRAPAATFASQAAYGASFALASMSCTIGPFIAVVSGALHGTGPLAKALPFLAYGIGMGTSILIISVIAALAGSTVVAGLRRRTPAIMRAAGWFMILAGIYALLYGLAEVFQRFGITALAGVQDATLGWQGSLTRTIHGWGLPAFIALAVVAVGGVVWLFRARREPR
jgi:cytochrome c biogenesis protein CcdA